MVVRTLNHPSSPRFGISDLGTFKVMQKAGVSPVHDLPRLLFSVRETAHMIGGISEKSVYRLIQRGLLKCSPALRHKMITAESIKAFVALSAKEVR